MRINRFTGAPHGFGSRTWHSVFLSKWHHPSLSILWTTHPNLSSRLVDRMLELGGATIEEVASARALLGPELNEQDGEVLLVGDSPHLALLHGRLVDEGFVVFLRDLRPAIPSA